MFFKTNYLSPIGTITLCSDGKNLVGAWFEGQKYFAQTVKDKMIEKPDLEVLSTAKSWLDRYFVGEKPEISELPLAPAGSAFRQAVWKLLTQIPYGEVITYKELAGQIARQRGQDSMSAQAIGGAVGHNPISIIIPCHRVLGSDGSLTGYAGGLEIKRKLLEHEGIHV